MTTTTIEDTEVGLAKGSSLDMIIRLLGFMKPFNTIMFYSLLTRSLKFIGQAAVLGIAAQTVGLYIEAYEPNVVNWDLIWAQVIKIAIAGTIVGFCSYIENYTGH